MTNKIFTYVRPVELTRLNSELEKAGLTPLVESVVRNGSILVVTTTRDLGPTEKERLYKVVVAHRPPTAEEIAAQAKMISAIQFGQKLILEFATENVLLKLTTSQIAMLLTRLAPLKAMLESGSLNTALLYIETFADDRILPADRVEKYKNKIKEYLSK